MEPKEFYNNLGQSLQTLYVLVLVSLGIVSIFLTLVLLPFRGKGQGQSRGQSLRSHKIPRIIYFNQLLMFVVAFVLGLHIWNYGTLRSVAMLDFFIADKIYVTPSYMICIVLDGYAGSLITLLTIIVPIAMAVGQHACEFSMKQYVLCILVTQLALIMAFCVLDFLVFYIMLEVTTIPMYFLIGFWGSQKRRTKASTYLVIYTVFGSLLMLFTLVGIYATFGSIDYLTVCALIKGTNAEFYFCLGIFIPLAIKVPMWLAHIWLPEAHVEAPTGGSILLAAVTIKLGLFGFHRYVILAFPYATEYYKPYICALAAIGCVFAAFSALRQKDFKRNIAYSSIVHMNLAVVGLFIYTNETIKGAYIMMLGHGLTSTGLFFLAGILYDRHKTRNVLDFGGLAQKMPLFTGYFLFFVLANIGFPGTVNFTGEFLVLYGLTEEHPLAAILCLGALLISCVYSFWIFNRISFGVPKNNTRNYQDLSRVEHLILAVLTILVCCLGMQPDLLIRLLF